ncbi:MAG: hypothetical protein E7533_04200 [Ruminococcaceae bacterium]|nr:hypothetical protein [Oscillospiraceae bacterium]
MIIVNLDLNIWIWIFLRVLIPVAIVIFAIIAFVKLIKSKTRKNIIRFVVLLVICLLIPAFWFDIEYKKTSVSQETINELVQLDLAEIEKFYVSKGREPHDDPELYENIDILVHLDTDPNGTCYNYYMEERIYDPGYHLVGEKRIQDNALIVIYYGDSDYMYDSNIFDLHYLSEILIIKDGYVLTLAFENSSNNDKILMQTVDYLNEVIE